jgi:predicted nucleotidyltransferase
MIVDDHLRLYKFLKKEDVKYIVIGGAATIAYGVPRTTNDLDIFIEPTPENCARLLRALKETGLGTALLTSPKKIANSDLTVVEDFIRLDILTKVKGLEFRKSWDEKVTKKIDGIAIHFISLGDLIRSKKAIGRKIDKEDIRILNKIKNLGR